ncbi:hypothetical protein [Sphingomonas crocodyli]|uniref:hypothetical protein n=1 Tax=Sphingomonas crocodyli TaxID=1979270 RepID=UPI0013E2D6A1|nr:hypothetical protein [Sphingomonas crocodyli]
MLQWLTDSATSFNVRHNAHRTWEGQREIPISLREYLQHAERTAVLGAPSHRGAAAECLAHDEIWEIDASLSDGARTAVFGPTLAACLAALRAQGRIPGRQDGLAA